MNHSPDAQPMTRYESNATLADVAAALHDARNVVITTHAKPDGDALGSVLALARALEQTGKRVERWFIPPILGSLRTLLRGVTYHEYRGADDSTPKDEPDRIVVVDTGAWAQLEPFHHWLAARRKRVILLDHHLRGDDVASLRFIDSHAAAACEIVAKLIDVMGIRYDLPIAQALYVGIASDTGWFRFSNAGPFTHELAARLLRCGVDHAAIYAQLEQAERPQKLLLLIRALDSLELVAGGRAAVMTLSAADFGETGALPEETERLVDLPQIVQDVQVVVLITEDEAAGRIRLSFRSKPGPDAVDVNRLARQFGGGGHARAAGAKVNATLAEVRDRVFQAVHQIMPD